jgi:hypothetical protein
MDRYLAILICVLSDKYGLGINGWIHPVMTSWMVGGMPFPEEVMLCNAGNEIVEAGQEPCGKSQWDK